MLIHLDHENSVISEMVDAGIELLLPFIHLECIVYLLRVDLMLSVSTIVKKCIWKFTKRILLLS
jgi:hypothetical protein